LGWKDFRAKLLYSAMNTKTKTTMMVMAAALLCGIGNVCAYEIRSRKDHRGVDLISDALP
jgi:hypothetical protein